MVLFNLHSGRWRLYTWEFGWGCSLRFYTSKVAGTAGVIGQRESWYDCAWTLSSPCLSWGWCWKRCDEVGCVRGRTWKFLIYFHVPQLVKARKWEVVIYRCLPLVPKLAMWSDLWVLKHFGFFEAIMTQKELVLEISVSWKSPISWFFAVHMLNCCVWIAKNLMRWIAYLNCWLEGVVRVYGP